MFRGKVVSKGTLAEGARIALTKVPALLRCKDCSCEFGLESHGVCPTCGRRNGEVIRGRECYVDTIELGLPLAVIEGDIASTFDAEKVGAKNVPVVQIKTGGECHLDAAMIRNSLRSLDVEKARFLFIENVGNLVCPAEFLLGEQIRLLIASVPEGDDKPFTYPGTFSTIHVVVLNKMDLIPYIDFITDRFIEGIYAVNPEVPVFQVSCQTGGVSVVG